MTTQSQCFKEIKMKKYCVVYLDTNCLNFNLFYFFLTGQYIILIMSEKLILFETKKDPAFCTTFFAGESFVNFCIDKFLLQ